LTAVLDTVASVVPPPSTFVVYPYPRIMSREEAEAEAGRLSAEHPERDRHHWLARERDGDWEVVRIPLPPGQRIDPLKATVETKPKPPEPDDPRTSFDRNVGGPYGGV